MDDFVLFRTWLNTDFSNLNDVNYLIEVGERDKSGYVFPGFNYPYITILMINEVPQDLLYQGQFIEAKSKLLYCQEKLNEMNKKVRAILDHFNDNNFEFYVGTSGISDQYLAEVNEKIRNVHFAFNVKGLSKDEQGVKLKLNPSFNSLEELLYFQLAQMINTEAPLISCNWCGKYIENPTQGQLGNVARNMPAYDSQLCWEEAKRKKDRDRKRRKNSEGKSDV